MEEKTLPLRSEIDPALQWNLEDMFPSVETWETRYRETQQQIAQLGQFKGTLAESGEQLLKALQTIDEVSVDAEQLYVYASLRRDEDNAVGENKARADRAMRLMVDMSGETAYLVPEILAIPHEKLEIMRKTPGMEVFAHGLDDIERGRAHTLSAAEERILARTGEMSGAADDIYSMLTDVDMRFPSVTMPDGTRQEITQGRYIAMMRHPDRRVRREAFEKYYAEFEKMKHTLAESLNASCKKDWFYASVRNYPSTLAASLDGDNVDPCVYDALIKAVHDALPLMYRYMALRKRQLGLDELHMYDLYVSLADDVDLPVTYEEGQQWCLEGLKPLGEEYIRVLGEGFNSRWVDVHENRGKTSGAYSWGAWGCHPYVLMNWQDDVDHVFTLAHEMGHAMHSYLSNHHQPHETAHYPLILAEVASTCNEALLMHHLLGKHEDKALRRYLICDHLEQFRTTMFRQTMFAEFEKIIHEMADKGETLTSDKLCQIYHDLNVLYYGPDMVVDPQIDMEWSRIPHFYRCFYVYKYATGYASAMALSRQVLDSTEGRDRYLSFLSSGGSDYPLDLLARGGVDLRNPEAIRQALKTFGDLVDEMETLVQDTHQ